MNHVRSAKSADSISSLVEPTQRELLWTVKEASKMLNVSRSTLYGWVWQRRIPFVKVGRALRFSSRDLEQFIEANRFKALK